MGKNPPVVLGQVSVTRPVPRLYWRIKGYIIHFVGCLRKEQTMFLLSRKSLVLAVIMSAVLFGRSAVFAEEEKPGLKIGVINFTKLFDEYKKTQAINKQIQEKFGVRSQELKKRASELESRIKALQEDVRPKNDPALVADQQRWNADKADFDRDQRSLFVEMNDYNTKHTKQIFAEIKEAIKRYASSKGFDIVLRTDNADLDQAESVQSLMLAFRTNPVLFYSDSVDITDEVLTLLNLAFDRGIELVPDTTKASNSPK